MTFFLRVFNAALLTLVTEIFLIEAGGNIYDPCYRYRCYNGGYCIAPADAPYCQCPAGFTGQRCETVVDVKPGLCPAVHDILCRGTLCHSDTNCRGTQKCCRNKCGDKVCSEPLPVSRDPCQTFVCQNGGTCTAPADVPTCRCPPGFFGTNCEYNRDPCYFVKCYNGGYCTAPADAPYCVCPPGYTGDRCQTPITPPNSRCPTIKNDTVGVCGGVFCSRDADCAKDELCCPSACGGFLCTRRSPVTPNPPRVDIENPCLFIKCSATTVCRVVYKCQTCEPTVQCVNSSLIDASLDRSCRKGGYSEVLLVDGPTPTSNYVPLVCRHERDCPRGSMCVGDRRGEGTCCRGRIESSPDKPGVCPVGANLTCGARCDLDIDCPDDQKCCQSCGRRCTRPQPPAPTCPTPCPRGTTCTWTSPVCSPGMACPQYIRYECTPDPCLTCRDDEKCVLTSTKGYQCQPRNPCGRTCPAGQQCQLTRTVCASGTDINPRPTGCRDIYECRPVDLCGGCLQGTVCIDTGIRCITTPCPTYQCVPDNACGGCRPGQRCRELLACSPPATCNKNAPCPPVCSSVFQCTSAPEPVVRPPCPLPCPPLTRCEIQHKKCKGDDRLCAREVSYKCRPLYGDD